jgi:hypothetical protein
MTVAMIGRWVAAVAGALLVLTAWSSVVVTLIVARPVGNWLTRWVDRMVNGAFRLATSRLADYRRRDRILARQAAAILRALRALHISASGRVFWGSALENIHPGKDDTYGDYHNDARPPLLFISGKQDHLFPPEGGALECEALQVQDGDRDRGVRWPASAARHRWMGGSRRLRARLGAQARGMTVANHAGPDDPDSVN